MDTFLDRTHRDREVGEVGGADDDSLDLAGHLVEHLPEVLVLRDAGAHADDLLGVRCAHVDVAKGHDIDHPGLQDVPGVFTAPVADTDEGDIDLLRGALGLLAVLCRGFEGAQRIDGQGCRRGTRRFQEISSGNHMIRI